MKRNEDLDMKKVMTVDEFKEIVGQKNEHGLTETFGVEFTKANGEYRKMSARRSVSKGVKNDSSKRGSWNRKENDAEHNLLTVYDMNKVDENKPLEESKGAHRRIPLSRLKKVKIKGVVYVYDEERQLLVEE